MAKGVANLEQQVVEPAYRTRPVDVTVLHQRSAELQALVERDQRSGEILRVVEADILPRIRGGLPSPLDKRADVPPGTYSDATLHLVDILLVEQCEETLASYVEGLLAEGAAADTIYLDLFQPAACRIGELWTADLCTFVDVTLAIGTLQKMMQRMSASFYKDSRAVDMSRCALLVPMPGEQHTFGLSMVSEFFQRAGWMVEGLNAATIEELGDLVQATSFAIAGLSAGVTSRIDDVNAAVALLKRRSCNKAIKVMVGGPLFVNNPDYAASVGADAMGVDAREALGLAENFVANTAWA